MPTFPYFFTYDQQYPANSGWSHAAIEGAAEIDIDSDGTFSVAGVQIDVTRCLGRTVERRSLSLPDGDPLRAEITAWLTTARQDDVRAAWLDEQDAVLGFSECQAEHRPSPAQMGV